MTEGRRLRDDGIPIGRMQTGVRNDITDVPGVRVGHVTLTADTTGDSDICTGVTAILPHLGNWYADKVPTASYVINGYGKTTGLVQVQELGVLESPILLTNTFSVPAVTEGALQYMLEHMRPTSTLSSINVVAGECNDSYLNDMSAMAILPDHAELAIERAKADAPVTEGSVGAGTGMRCFGWKGGIGSSSRVLQCRGVERQIGVLSLCNFGDPADLTILGLPVGMKLRPETMPYGAPDGSVIVVIATDLPLDTRQLGRLCRRVPFALARVGSIAHHGSGDIALAFRTPSVVQPDEPVLTAHEEGELISECFRAIVEATEESILNALFMAETTYGRDDRVLYRFPAEQIVEILRTMTQRWYR
jgi:D-aminopeptidase